MLELCTGVSVTSTVYSVHNNGTNIQLTSIDKKNVTILWDANIQTDHVIEHRRPDIVHVVADKDNTRNNRALLIDIVVPGDTRVDEKKHEKMDKYQDLAR